MSDFKQINIGEEASSLDVSEQFDGYSGVEIVDEEGNAELVGTTTGRVITIEGITREQAQDILETITGFRYQPLKASGVLINPAAEIGDAVIVNDVYSGVYKLSRSYTPNMVSYIEAPQEEEVDHEYPFESKQDRVFKREIAQTRAQIKVNSDSIESEVFRATQAEGELHSAITQTASDITAEVRANYVENENTESSSFGWRLKPDSWELFSNGNTVFKATSSGVEVTGKITASSGTIGGFNIATNNIWNGMPEIDSPNNGVYIGTDGISVGAGNFKVRSNGTVSAKNMTLSGTLTIGGKTISAANLQLGAYQASQHYGSWSTGSGYGYDYNSAQMSSGGTYPTFFKVNGDLQVNRLFAGGWPLTRRTLVINNVHYPVWTWDDPY